MASNLHRDWKRDWNKDKLAYYKNPDFQEDYIELEMDRKAEIFERQCEDEVQEVLRQIWRKSPNRKRIWILSLGCGPGSDLLGILRAVDSVLQTDPQVGWEFDELECYCIGVDAFDWDRGTFEQQVDELYRNEYIGRIHCTFYRMKMEAFVHDSSEPNGLIPSRFDFICMSFADAGRNLQLVGTALPKLLKQTGRVLVLDNDIPTVKRLAEFGYTCTFSGPTFCMHSRGYRQQSSANPYEPSPSFSVQIYKQQKKVALMEIELDRERKRLVELERRDQEELRHRRQAEQLAASMAGLRLEKFWEEIGFSSW